MDAVWHAFILYTADYAEFRHRVAGRFIRHRPNGPKARYGPEHARSFRAQAARAGRSWVSHRTD